MSYLTTFSDYYDGDVDEMLREYIIEDEFPDIAVGKWVLIDETSDAMGKILHAMRYTDDRFRIRRSPKLKIEKTGDDNILRFVAKSESGVSKSQDVPFDGRAQEKDNGQVVHSFYTSGRWMMRREVPGEGILYDCRAFLNNDPLGQVACSPILMHKMTFIEEDSGVKTTCTRYFRRKEDKGAGGMPEVALYK